MNKKIELRAEKSLGLFLLVMMVILWLFPVVCMAASENAVQTDLEDGEYSIDVKFEGGSGRAEIESPAVLLVKDGQAYARIAWDSPNYDYMKVGTEKYLPVNENGNSVFEIPVTVFNEPMTVIGDTTAMSVPHEVEYTLVFDENSISTGEKIVLPVKILVFIFVLILAVCLICMYKKRKYRKGK